ncbi:hypothetical protein RI129_004336 [Pyrocoelia pectoralis]|uniref:Uncharacterized protein n=1 Tax=Pyrocoelia pectoralis TaxID=417401 RepID=A0AAN7ZJ80_9COLE
MKVFVIFACLVVVKSAPQPYLDDSVDDLLEQRIASGLRPLEEVVNDVVNRLANRDPLDVAKNVSININGHYYNFSQVHLEGFSNVIQRVSLNGNIFSSSFEFHLTLPQVSGWVKSFSSDLPLFQGKVINGSFSIRNYKFNARIGVIFGRVQPSKVVTTIERANVTVAGTDNDQEWSDKLSHKIVEVVNSHEYHKIIGRIVDRYVKKLMSRKWWELNAYAVEVEDYLSDEEDYS